MNPAERDVLIAEYAAGPAKLRVAWAACPEAARQWRPDPAKWSAHEVIVHCADSETNAAARIRYLTTERDPVIIGYDQEAWAREHDYHQHSPDLALATIEAVRANTVPFLRRMDEGAWNRMGRHTESGAYGSLDWLKSYAKHVTNHAAQIDRNVAAWRAASGVGS
jgi:hypothetical protein